jgi:hypothetical protein
MLLDPSVMKMMEELHARLGADTQTKHGYESLEEAMAHAVSYFHTVCGCDHHKCQLCPKNALDARDEEGYGMGGSQPRKKKGGAKQYHRSVMALCFMIHWASDRDDKEVVRVWLNDVAKLMRDDTDVKAKLARPPPSPLPWAHPHEIIAGAC